jgi:hypothetical protein
MVPNGLEAVLDERRPGITRVLAAETYNGTRHYASHRTWKMFDRDDCMRECDLRLATYGSHACHDARQKRLVRKRRGKFKVPLHVVEEYAAILLRAEDTNQVNYATVSFLLALRAVSQSWDGGSPSERARVQRTVDAAIRRFNT